MTHLEFPIHFRLTRPRREIPQMSLHLMICKIIVLLILLRLEWGIIVFFIAILSLFFVTLLP